MPEKEPPPMREPRRHIQRQRVAQLLVPCFAAFGTLSACAGFGAPVRDPLPTTGESLAPSDLSATSDSPAPGHAPATGDVPAGPSAASATGVLVMAHGGGAEWNAAVAQAVAPLRDRIPLALALGMADPRTLQAGLDSLAARGARDVAVVRLFLSGASFLHQTQYLFGMRSDPPPWGMIGHRMTDGADLRPLTTDARIFLDLEGLAGSRAANGIMAERAEAAAPERDAGVLLVAHGMGAEDENDRLLALMERSVQVLRTVGHPEVRAATLREDWARARAVAEDDMRAAVDEMRERHGRVVVLPYRLYGFGPYADVLEGLAYENGPALLPHPLVTDWIVERAASRFCAAGLPSPLASCASSADPARGREPATF